MNEFDVNLNQYAPQTAQHQNGCDNCPEQCPAAVQYSVEGCERSEEIPMEGCSNVFACDLGNQWLDSTGRILELRMRLKNVCPNRRVAVAVALHELDEQNREFPRGMKTFTVPAHTMCGAQDVELYNMRFVLPDDLARRRERDQNGYACRRFVARVVCHYVDHNYTCCPNAVTL